MNELANGGRLAVSALGAGVVAVQDGHFVYDQPCSDEGMPIGNCEIGGASSAGRSFVADGSLILRLINIDSPDHHAPLACSAVV